MITDLEELIAINSICGAPEENAPFGEANGKALALFLSKAESYGLKTGNDDWYAGWAEYGEGDAMIGILGHLDVVPAGDGWSTDPFKLTMENGRLCGRGVSDDKGPLVACLHALKKLKDENAELGCRVRIIAGCNEESGSECVKHYVRHREIPTVSFTPDSDFPVIASEKGIAHLKIVFPASKCLKENFKDISGGSRPNIVPNYAEFVIKRDSPLFNGLTAKYKCIADILREENIAERLATDGCPLADFAFEFTSEGLKVSAKGAAAHGSTPEKGDNALRKTLSLLSALTDDAALRWANEYAATPYSAKRLGVAAEDETGSLTLNLGMCAFERGALSFTLDLRTPACSDYGEIKKKIAATLPPHAKIQELHRSEPLVFDEDDKLVRTLLEVYRRETGDYLSKPLHIGGGTYAKELPNCVAFGAVFPGMDTRMHEPDEFYPVEDLYRIEKIYYEAIKALCREYKK